jgi:tetratricopeptide (TPR) repeat protein
MLTFLKRPLYVISNKIRRNNHGKTKAKKWVADFSKPEKSPFNIKSEFTYNAYLSNGSLAMELKKTNCIAWVESSGPEYQDQVIEARFRLDGLGGYAAAGLMFRIADEGTYYLALISNKSYFRLDVVKNTSPRPLVGWTETPDINGGSIELTIIACGVQMIFLVNGNWIAEISDDTIDSGRFGFALASYENAAVSTYSCQAWLDHLQADSRIKAVENFVKKWTDNPDICAENRLHLAETFAAMGEAALSLAQLRKVWERREEAAKSVGATYTEMRSRKELLLAARLAIGLGQYDAAGEWIDACLDLGTANPEGKEALAEKVKFLEEQKKFAELRDFMVKYTAGMDMDSALYDRLARAHWQLHEYKPAAAAWDKAFRLEKSNGVYAANAANALELLGKYDTALKRFLEAGKIFLRQNNYDELAAVVPKLVSLGEQNWEARTIAGKWAFSVEEYGRAESEFAAAERIRRKIKPMPAADPAVSYLRGVILMLKDKYREAGRFFAEAVRLSPNYGLFRFKLAENQFYLNGGAAEPALAGEMRTAVSLMDDESGGRMANHAGTLLLRSGDFINACDFFSKALSVDPDNVEYLSNHVSGLMSLGRYSQADDLLTQARLRKPSEELNALIQLTASGINPFAHNDAVATPGPKKQGDTKKEPPAQ